MAARKEGVYADHPFPLLNTPTSKLPEGTKPTIFHDVASEMTLVHNCVFRGLNSIYLQAKHVKPADQPAFAHYMWNWYNVLHIHHEGEEAILFPEVERMTGEKGIMDVNIEQHRAFHDGLEEFRQYSDALITGKEKYSGDRVIEIIDGFGPALCKHLTEEIGTLLGLEKHGLEKMNSLPAVAAREGETSMKQAGLLTGLPWFAVNLDRKFEDDRWLTVFPPGPGQFALALVRNTTYWAHRDWWKFGSCDRFGNPRPLYAGDEGSTVTKTFAPHPVVEDLAVKPVSAVHVENKPPAIATA